MAHRYEFIAAAARDLHKLTQRNHPLLMALVLTHIPAIIDDPYKAGAPKKGDLAGLRAYDLQLRNVAYRLIFAVEEDTVVFVAIGPHATAYERAGRRS